MTWNTKSSPLKLTRELGGAKAAAELGIPKNAMYAWPKAARKGRLDVGPGSRTPQTGMNLTEELALLRRQVKEREKEIRHLNRMRLHLLLYKMKFRNCKLYGLEKAGGLLV